MKTKLLIILSIGLALSAYAGSATWSANPMPGGWNTAENWAPPTVPDGPTDVATFQVSNKTDISINTLVEVDRVVFDPGASAYSLTVKHFQWLILMGDGIINLSDQTQRFTVLLTSQIRFMNNASAGTGTLFHNQIDPGTNEVNFTSCFDNSTASGGAFTNDGGQSDGMSGASTQFHSESNAGDGIFLNLPGSNGGSGGTVFFWDSSDAVNGTFTNQAGPDSHGSTLFENTSSAGHGNFVNQGASQEDGEGGGTYFFGTSTAAQAILTSEAGTFSGAEGGFVQFDESSSAGEATLVATGGTGNGGKILFLDGSDGGTARVELFGNGFLDLASHLGGGVTVGSLEGDGLVFLGSNNLSIGSNNLTTTFSGSVQDTGSVTKLGTGTLTLSGASTYSGGTTITSGILLVSNTSGSGTGTGSVSVNAGTLGGSGIIAGAVAVGTNSGVQAFLAPSKGAKKPAKLTIQSLLTLNDDSTYIYKLDTKRLKADEVIANGVTIDDGAKFSFRPSGNNVLTAGQVFTVISNTSTTPIAGTFHNLRDGQIISVNGNNLQASYSGGDGNDLTLSVVQ